jgi:DNA topoisomerase-1
MGVLFPPAYEPHGVPLVYDGKDLILTSHEEEVASMFAAMKDTDYAAKEVFVKNFFNDFVAILTPATKKIIKKFNLLDFTKIYMHLAEVCFEVEILTIFRSESRHLVMARQELFAYTGEGFC